MRRLSLTELKILLVLQEHGSTYQRQLVSCHGVPAGSGYGALRSLQRKGCVRLDLENGCASALGRPLIRRAFITDKGRNVMGRELSWLKVTA